MTRLQQAHARRAKIRAVQAALEAFIDGYIAETGEQPSLVISTALEWAFDALMSQLDSVDRAGATAHEIFEALCVKHQLHAPTERSLDALASRAKSHVDVRRRTN